MGENMSIQTNAVSIGDSSPKASALDTKLEVISVPVSDVDRAKEFYMRLGWRLDADFDNGKDSRVIQFTPPGSSCSVVFGRNVAASAPGSLQGLLIVSDIEAARADLMARGIEGSEIFHCASGPGCRFPGRNGRVGGAHPERLSYGSYLSFSDPDGNTWQFQEVTTRHPGRIAGGTTYSSSSDLSEALRRAAAAHGQHEKRIGHVDADWPDWYAEYMVHEQKGDRLPQ
jgi:catechol 2,3-dioxygenase-like lactoylglutathione lyase family enzyme